MTKVDTQSKSKDRFGGSELEKSYNTLLEEIEKDPVKKNYLFDYGVKKFIQSVCISQKDAFLSNFLINMTFEPTLDFPTAGVCFDKNTKTFSIKYNPIFIAFFSQAAERDNSGIDFTSFILYHEIKHIALCFFQKLEFVESLVPKERLEDLGKDMVHRMKNIAHDLSINTMLRDIMCNFYKREENLIGYYPGCGAFSDYPEKLSMEEYFIRLSKDEQLKDKMKSNKEMFIFDDHDFMDMIEGLSESDKEIIKSELREQINNAMNKSISAGNTGSEILKSLSKLIKPPDLNLDSVLSFFIEKSIYTKKKPSIKKLNKKVPYIIPGKNKMKTSHLALAIDQSGSVDDNMLVKLLMTCEKFLDHTSIDIIPFDCGDIDASKISKLKQGDKIKLERVLTGGTDFNKPTDFVNNSDIYDGLIIFTDLQAEMPGPCSVERMWVSSSECKNSAIENCGEIVLKFSP